MIKLNKEEKIKEKLFLIKNNPIIETQELYYNTKKDTNLILEELDNILDSLLKISLISLDNMLDEL